MKLRGFAAAVLAGCVLTAAAEPVFADEVNLLASYGSMDWQGDSLALDSTSGAVYFDSGDGLQRYAMLEVAAEGNGIYFSVDAGNGVNSRDSGYCTLEFCGEDGKVLSSVSTGSIKKLENYSRFYIGSEGSYYPLPEGTEKIVIGLHADPISTGKVNVYFRNFMLYVSSEKPLTQELTYMDSIAGLTKVEVGLNPWVRWIWVGVVFAVAMVFFLVRKMREKYKSPEIMKAGRNNS